MKGVVGDQVMGAGEDQAKLKFIQNETFHTDDVIFGVGVCADVNKVVDDRWTDFLVLGSSKKTSSPDELEDLFADEVLF